MTLLGQKESQNLLAQVAFPFDKLVKVFFDLGGNEILLGVLGDRLQDLVHDLVGGYRFVIDVIEDLHQDNKGRFREEKRKKAEKREIFFFFFLQTLPSL